MRCPCGSQMSYDACCRELIDANRVARTPEELMRSRYSAYVVGAGGYLVETTSEENRYEGDAALIEEHVKSSEWLKLEVLSSNEAEEEGSVEFKAYYKEHGEIRVHYEKSLFKRVAGRWYYDAGTLYECKPGRNEACPCGSGKKYKKCCGK